MNKKIIASHKAPLSRSMGPHVRQVIPSAVEHIDPFVFLDHFGPFDRSPEASGVPPHPHAGIATITYLLEGSNRHQDSYGHDAIINAGDLAWMQAGKGIVHAEGMNENRTENQRVHGLQLWISLPAKDKFSEPDFFHYPSQSLPELQREGARIKVLSGTLWGASSPVTSLSPAYMYDLQLSAGTQLEIPIPEGYTTGVYTIQGRMLSDGQLLTDGVMTKYDNDGSSIVLLAESDSRCLILGGKPLNEPIVAYASFVMNSEEQIHQVVQDYHAGKMGTVNN